MSPVCAAGLGEPGCGDCRRPHLAPACGNVAPAGNTGSGCARRPLDEACAGHAGAWSSGDVRGWESSRGDRRLRACGGKQRPCCNTAPCPPLAAPGHPSAGKTSRSQRHPQRKKVACCTRVTRGGPAWMARRPRRPFSSFQTSLEPLDPLWGSGRGGGSGAPCATPASGPVAWSLGARSLQSLPPPPPLEGVAVPDRRMSLRLLWAAGGGSVCRAPVASGFPPPESTLSP